MIDRPWWKVCALVVVATILGACASSPLATAARTRGFNVEEFFIKDPRDIRVALRTDDRAKRGAADPSLVARTVVGAGEARCHALALVAIDPSDPQQVAPEKPAADRRWFVFKLSTAGIESFERARREVRQPPTAGGNLNVTVALQDVIEYADDPRGSPLRIDFALDRSGYFPMLAETTIHPSRTTATAKPAAPCGVA